MNGMQGGIPAGIPTIGAQRAEAEAMVNRAVQGLQLGIYSQLAVSHIGKRDPKISTLDPDELRQLARDAQTAAKAYFEGLGLASFRDNSKG